jgi:hypothetical protein
MVGGGSGGDILSIGGSLTIGNSGIVGVGNSEMNSPSAVNASGALINTGTVGVTGGSTVADTALLDISGPAPATLTGNYGIGGGVGSAAVEFGSGSITNIGTGAPKSGSVTLNGPNAYMEVGATNSNNALTTVTTLAGGGLYLLNGVSLTTTSALRTMAVICMSTSKAMAAAP